MSEAVVRAPVGARSSPRRRWRVRPLQYVGRAIVFAIVAATSAGFVFPLFWMISTSLKDESQVFAVPPVWFPGTLLLGNYPLSFTYFPFFQDLENTMIITVPSVVATVISSVLVAYGFARIKWPGRDALFILVLATLMIPDYVTLIPVYILFAKLHWVGTFLPLIVPRFFGSAFFIFLLRQFFLRHPQELIDAAIMDGAGHVGILWRIILPLSKPALAVVALFQFQNSWTDFFGPLIFLSNPATYTLSLGLFSFQSQHATAWAPLMAASLVVVAPMIIIFFFAQRTLIEGITFTGIRS